MIEVVLKTDGTYKAEMQLFSELYTWLVSMALKAEPKPILLQGTIAIFDFETSKLNILLLCEGNVQEQIEAILKAPPEKYQDSFTFSIVKNAQEKMKEDMVEKEIGMSD